MTLATLGLIAFPTIYIDPLFHYHAPLKKYEYPIDDERYQNDGIVRHFEYNGIIAGTSMVENFKTSEADILFDANFIKVPFSGGRYKEINDNLKRAFESKKDIKYVIRCLDYSLLLQDKDAYRKDVEYPTYLYNNNIFDDVKYMLNKTILLNRTYYVLKYTKAGRKTTKFDEYVNWNDDYEFGKEAVLATYTLGGGENESRILTEKEREIVLENIQQNVTALVRTHPETTFYIFFPPYSICYWHALENSVEIDWRIDIEQVAIEEIIKYPNIKLFSFCNNFDLVCNLDNYRDQAHYGEWVNSWILEWIYEGKYQITEENYREYLKELKDFYNNYDYRYLSEDNGDAV